MERRQAAKNNRAIDTPWIVPPGPDTIFSKKQVWNHYRSFNRLGKESVYGTVFRVSRKQAEKFLESMDRDSQTRYGRLTETTQYALKIIHKRRDLDWRDFAIVVQREANIQMMVHTSFPDITPPVVFAGMNHTHGTGYIASPWVPGLKSLDKRYTTTMYPSIDNMFSKVWYLGLLHMDAHLNNIFTTSSNRFMLLDWGASAFVPVNLVDDLKRRLHQRGDDIPLHEVWKTFVQDHPGEEIERRLYNQVIYRAGAPSLRKRNADWLVLRALFQFQQQKGKTTVNNKKEKGPKQMKLKKRKRSNTTTDAPNTKKKRIFRRVVAKGSAPAFRRFPYPDSAWSKILFDTTPKNRNKKEKRMSTIIPPPDTPSKRNNQSKKNKTSPGSSSSKKSVGRNSKLSSVTANPAIRMEQSLR